MGRKAGLTLDPATAVPLMRALRASIHRFIDLEIRGGFGLPRDIDDSFTATIDLVTDAIVAHSTTREIRTPKMKLDPGTIVIEADAADTYRRLGAERQRRLVAPEDDMWATFADMAEPHALTIGTQLAGRFSVDEENQLHGFYIIDEFEPVADELFAHVVDHMGITAAMASTVDPTFLSLSLTASVVADSVALMYDHVAPPAGVDTVDVRLATSADHAAAVAFYQAATGSPEAFLAPYLAERIELQELYLLEADGQIAATGECRVDQRAPGNAHLGLVVGTELRGHGVGSRLMHTLAEICRDRDMTPHCSTEPTNLAAQTVIRRAGFRTRHQIFKIGVTAGSTGSTRADLAERRVS